MRKTTMTTDMTVGSPTKHILTFALPLLVGNLFQQLYNMVDSFVVGNFVGKTALAAVGACGSLNFFFFSIAFGLSVGAGCVVSQYFGAKDEQGVRASIANSYYIVLSMAVLVTILAYIYSPFILESLLDTPASLLEQSITYMQTTSLGMVGIAAYNGVAAILRSLGDSRSPLYFLILSSIINLVLDLVFVIYFDMEVFGVALATVIAQFISAVAIFLYAYKKMPYFRLKKSELAFDIRMIMKTFRIGLPIAFQNATISISCMVLQRFVNGFGDDVIAAYAITGRIEQLVHQPYGSLSTALTTYSGQNMGAGLIERVKTGFNKSVKLALGFSLLMIPLFGFFGDEIASFFLDGEQNLAVIEIAYKGLGITSLCYFGLGMIYLPRAVLNGCGDAGFAFVNGLVEVVCRIAYAALFTSIPELGYIGIWLTTGATWVTTAVVCLARYFTGAWKKKSLIGDVSRTA